VNYRSLQLTRWKKEILESFMMLGNS